MNIYIKEFPKLFTLVFLILCCVQCTVSKNSLGKSNPAIRFSRDGGCQAKCLIPVEFALHIDTFYVSTGSKEAFYQGTIDTSITIFPKSTEWVKKKADKNCNASNPDDCLVWCLIENPAEELILTIVRDTFENKNFKQSIIEIKSILNRGGYTEWKEILCENEISSDLIVAIQKKMIAKELLDADVTGIMNRSTEEALFTFQKYNGLPIGQIDLETLDKLDINYRKLIKRN
jgi:hypothetical protein